MQWTVHPEFFSGCGTQGLGNLSLLFDLAVLLSLMQGLRDSLRDSLCRGRDRDGFGRQGVTAGGTDVLILSDRSFLTFSFSRRKGESGKMGLGHD